MSILREISHVAQDIAEAIKSAFQLDVEIVDHNITRVAATGSAKTKVGTEMSYGTVTKQVIQTKKHIIIDHIGLHKACKSCNGFGKCSYTGGIIVPIFYNGETIGTINVVAYDDERLRVITTNQSGLVDFLYKMAELLSAKINEKQLFEEQLQVNSALLTIINTIPNGVISVDQCGNIRQINHLAAKMLQLQAIENVEGKSVLQFLPDFPMKEVLAGKKMQNIELSSKIDGVTHRFIANIEPITVEEAVSGSVVTINDYEKVKQLAFEFTNPNERITFNDIISESPHIKNLKSLAAYIAKSNSTILITGESGTGKEMFARAIHEASPRSNRPFISINCGAIPETLIESELFGYEKGSFTGANQKGKPGKFELAHRGTIFLDEIGTMPLYLQVKLLRVLQTREIDKIGGTETIPVDVRVIAATNSNLEEMVKNGTFRRDLYYRLNVIPIKLPPLRERKEDIVLLANHFVFRYSKLLNRDVYKLSDQAIKALKAYHWPGNIRELENMIEYGINLARPGETILDIHHLPASVQKWPHISSGTDSSKDVTTLFGQPVVSKSEFEKAQIERLLAELGPTTKAKKEIAQHLGISLATLYRKIHFYQIEKKAFSK